MGNSYSRHIIGDLLREQAGFDGVEQLTEAERHLRILENGVDQFGGNNDIVPILEAYRLGCEKHGEDAMLARFHRSTGRLLVGSFHCGLFENPYLDPEESQDTVGCKAHCDAGFEAQIKSLVLVKNRGVLPIRERKKVYIPVSLQYRPYTAVNARQESIGQGDFREAENPNRSYRGKTCYPANESDLDLVLNTRRAMGQKPVIVSLRMLNPCVLAELEPAADAILVDFGVQQDALMTVICGGAEPSGLLPVQLPRDMETVEAHCEDKPLNLEPYVDSQEMPMTLASV